MTTTTDPQPVRIPPTFKTLLPFIRRAEELDRDTSRPESKLIAYFCRQYAMELGIKLRENDVSNESTDYLLSLMDRLENEKKSLPEFTQEEGKEICEDFATEIFSKADDEDRAGKANKSTARTFYAAGTFFDILTQFGDIPEDIVEKRRYCKYKAATILKAVKEGKTPTPGPPEGLDFKADDDGSHDASIAANVVSSTSEPFAPAVVVSPMQRSSSINNSAPLPFPPETTRSAGAMSFSELESTWHGRASTQNPPQLSAPSHSPPAARPNSAFLTSTPPPDSTQNRKPLSFPSAADDQPTSVYKLPSDPTSDRNTPSAVISGDDPPSSPVLAYDPPPAATSSNRSHETHFAPTSSYQLPSAPSPSYEPSLCLTSQAFQGKPERLRDTHASQNEINDAIEYSKFAIAALKVKDTKLAVERLEKALRIIRGA
ncbi:hydroxyproline-rich glycoprotein [Plasmopara halstedii]|uniref:Hydroxyproline-rich glycoprotein n=1 Tax=Plasmopara halstedii TaxID=4781 RepID=A0A0P1AG58_PLAHL|nr:hydroxyproline-rich glycoprotein [Plasmopara halstedii]CEG39439.1 hydroxyproline-rich glycoprotein [Plasmopara halstedii]|eukprot:XP_024575808.1 hydroxyproline-rich glycoprotein [Plasmopara halstedii]